MKKILLTLFAAIGFGLSVWAIHINGGFSYKEDGVTVGRIELRSNGTFSMRMEGEGSWSGNYDIEGELRPGDTNIITFYINGKPERGTFMWPLQGKKGIEFGGYYFEVSYR